MRLLDGRGPNPGFADVERRWHRRRLFLRHRGNGGKVLVWGILIVLLALAGIWLGMDDASLLFSARDPGTSPAVRTIEVPGETG